MKKLIKKIITIQVICTSLICFSQKKLTDLYKENNPSVFKIITNDYSDNTLSQGSGFFITSNGVGISNYHVFENSDIAYIIDYKNNKYKIDKIIDYNEELDLIKFSVKKSNTKPVAISLNKPSIGIDVFTISYPSGFSLEGNSTISKGIISGFRNKDGVNLIQSTANITHGSSGGGLFNYNGSLVGITSGTFAENLEDLHGSLYKVIPASYINKLTKNIQKNLAEIKYNSSYENILKLADLEDKNGNYSKAEDLLSRILKSNILNPRIYLKLANLYGLNKLNNKTKAYEFYEKAISIDQSYISAYLSYAITLCEYGDYYSSLNLCDRAKIYLSRPEDICYYNYSLGYIYIDMKNYAEATQYLYKAVVNLTENESVTFGNVKDSKIIYEYCYSLFKEKKYESSSDWLNYIINNYPEYYFPYLLKGDILYDLNDKNTACVFYYKVYTHGNLREKSLAKDRIDNLCR